jgi:hypothetical protein
MAVVTALPAPASSGRLQPKDIPGLFADRPDDPILNYEHLDVSEAKRGLEEDGFVIVKNLVPGDRIERLKEYWIAAFSKAKPSVRVTWSPYLGHTNHIGFTDDKFQHLFRACDFLWNEPMHQETRDVCIRVHALRNLVVDEEPFFGLRFTDARHGIFVTASYYPGGSGHMALHNDGVAKRKRLVHSLVPVTIKGKDYKDGGMVVVNRRGDHVDVDGELQAGDVVFYDGSLNHAVLPIKPFDGRSLGRIQVFPIPTHFWNLEDNTVAIARIPAARIAAAKWLVFKNFVRLKLGMKAAIR